MQRVDWLAMDDDDITKKFPILLEGILQDVYSQRAASAWQGAQPQKLTVSMLLPGTSSAAEWRDLLQSRRQFWPTLFFFCCIAELAIKPCRSSRSKLRGEFGIPNTCKTGNKNTTKQQTPPNPKHNTTQTKTKNRQVFGM